MNKEDVLVSVIVPVYNVEKYVAHCLDSIQRQTLTNLQVIIVDDGSTDRTLEICREYVAQDERFLVLSIPNSGVSSARNRALEEVKGTYIGFVDGDDLLEPQMFESLLTQVINEGADISICGYDRDERILGDFMQSNWKSYTKDTLIPKTYFSEQLPIEKTLWHMLFRWDRVSSIRFDQDLINGEDNLYIMKAFLASEKICVCDTPLYHYVDRHNSLTTSVSDHKILSRFLSSTRQCDLLIDAYPEYKKQAAHIGLIDTVNFAKKWINFADREDAIKAQVLECVNKYLTDFGHSPFSFWVYGNLLKHSWDIFEEVYRLIINQGSKSFNRKK